MNVNPRRAHLSQDALQVPTQDALQDAIRQSRKLNDNEKYELLISEQKGLADADLNIIWFSVAEGRKRKRIQFQRRWLQDYKWLRYGTSQEFQGEKKRAKRRAKYLQVRDDVLELARASYKADPEKKQTAEREGYHADPEKKRSAKRERYHADPEKKRSAKRESYEADPAKKQRPKNASGIMQTQKRNGQLKGNVIGRVLNVLAWRRECGTGRLSVPCKTNEAIEKELPTKLFKGM
ncbi:hypothetical protein EMCRGX_G033423 [Ephydatia muelleri]